MARGEKRQAAETEFKNEFKIRFRQLREEKGITQAAFADFLELSRPTIGFYENGDRMPDALALRRIAEKCQVSADYLVGITETRTMNISVRAICEATGLSENSVSFLKDLHAKDIFLKNKYQNNIEPSEFTNIKVINILLEELKETPVLLYSISRFLYFSKYVEQYYDPDTIWAFQEEVFDEKKAHGEVPNTIQDIMRGVEIGIGDRRAILEYEINRHWNELLSLVESSTWN